MSGDPDYADLDGLADLGLSEVDLDAIGGDLE